tara:strand:- start:118 stop:249 length:132 start_codon:yes stop_codon:yes gene_type:complete
VKQKKHESSRILFFFRAGPNIAPFRDDLPDIFFIIIFFFFSQI